MKPMIVTLDPSLPAAPTTKGVLVGFDNGMAVVAFGRHFQYIVPEFLVIEKVPGDWPIGAGTFDEDAA